MKKGITPIIAVILLLMMTVAGAAAAFFWFVRMQSELQGGTETYNEELSSKISGRVEIADTDTTTDNVSLFLKNQGTRTVALNNTYITMILKDQNNDVVCSSTLDSSTALECIVGCGDDEELIQNEIQKIVVEFGTDCNSGSLNDGEIYYYTIDFNGEAATGGQFRV